MFAADLFNDTGRVAVVTGGGTGIGLATARLLHELGCSVALFGRRLAVLEAAAASFTGRQQAVLPVQVDIREPDQVDRAVSVVVQRFGAISHLVNNAGGQFVSPVEAISPNGFAAVVRTNLLGTFHVTRAIALSCMLERGTGAIVNVTANVGRGFPGMAHSGAARAGVENMTRTLAIEWASRGIRVNAVAPGLVESEGTRQYPAELFDMARRATPQKRAGSPADIAHSVVFLLSPMARFITGATLAVDGGAQWWGSAWPIADA